MNIHLRKIKKSDCSIISDAFLNQGWKKPQSQYEEYLRLQKNGKRDVIIAEIDNQFSGYLTINWVSDYPPFSKEGIPEIVDFNVLKKYQRKGVGSVLMDEAERRVGLRSSHVGLGFGLYSDYGAAQVLYINRGYIPDGNGLVKDGVIIQKGDTVRVDDSVILFLTKKLNL